MANDAEFRREQRRVAAGMAAAALVSFLTIGGTLALGRGPMQPVGERIAEALKIDLVATFWLFAAIANVARLRFSSAEDIGGSGGARDASPSVRIGNAVLQNTLEQLVLALAVHLALAVMLPRPRRLILGLVLLFCIGRFCFWFGFSKGAASRAFGFALTFYPSALSLLMGIFMVFSGWSPQRG